MEYWICEKGSGQKRNPDGSPSKYQAWIKLDGKGKYFEIEANGIEKYMMEDLSVPLATQVAVPFFNGTSMFFLINRKKIAMDLKYGYMAFDIDPNETMYLFPKKLYGIPRNDWEYYTNLKPMRMRAGDVFAEMKREGELGIIRANAECKSNLNDIAYVTIPSDFIGRGTYDDAMYIRYKKGKDVFMLPTQGWVKWENLPEYVKYTCGAKNMTFAFVHEGERKCSKNHNPMEKCPMTTERLLEDIVTAGKAPPDPRSHGRIKNMEMEK